MGMFLVSVRILYHPAVPTVLLYFFRSLPLRDDVIYMHHFCVLHFEHPLWTYPGTAQDQGYRRHVFFSCLERSLTSLSRLEQCFPPPAFSSTTTPWSAVLSARMSYKALTVAHYRSPRSQLFYHLFFLFCGMYLHTLPPLVVMTCDFSQKLRAYLLWILWYTLAQWQRGVSSTLVDVVIRASGYPGTRECSHSVKKMTRYCNTRRLMAKHTDKPLSMQEPRRRLRPRDDHDSYDAMTIRRDPHERVSYSSSRQRILGT